MSEKNLLIIGPSNAGKTALLASFLYAVGQFQKSGYALHLQAKNENTRQVLQQAIEFIHQGQLPFQGTTSLMEYDFLFALEERQDRWWKRIWNGNTSLKSANIQLVDSPGGSVFGEEGEEIDYAVMGEYRRTLIEKLKIADGLVLCIDVAELNAQDGEKQRNGLMYAYLNDVFSRSLHPESQHGFPKIHAKRVFVCLNKCDLWALQEGYEGDALDAIHKLDPLKFTYDLLGQAFFNSLQTWFSPQTEIAMGFCSAYGFLDGGPNALLLSGIGMGDCVQREHVEAWKPFQVLAPFLFLVGGKIFGTSVRALQVKDLSQHLLEIR